MKLIFKSKIAEMKTGEGKTLISTLPAYLNSLSGKIVLLLSTTTFKNSADGKGAII